MAYKSNTAFMDKREKKRHIPIFVRMCFLIRLNYTIVSFY